MEYHLAESHDEKLSKAVELATQSAFKKTLVFVHSKVTGGNIVKSLRAAGVRAVFHNASLSSAKRRKIEEVFNNQTSGMNICVATSTLGSGVNAG
jgi:superfamily II DNA/RNA helicase